jgi:predicted TIM-barrel fold metal-dependent hydrolase
MKPYTLVSVDGHAGLPTERYRDYLERKYHAAFDQELEALAALRRKFLAASKNATETPLMYQAHMHRYSDPDNAAMQERIRGAWDIDVRLRELDAEGIAGEVLFPDGQGFNSFPFGGFFGEHPVPIRDPELRTAGARAHNRWLAEFCAAGKGRLQGVAMIMPFDIPQAVADVRWASAAGLRGIVLPPPDESYPPYHEKSFDPLWAVCADLGMAVHSHGGDPPKIYGEHVASQTLAILELSFFRRRILAQLIFGGVFVRHPKLRFVYTEVGIDWLPNYLEMLEHVYHNDWLRMGRPPKRWLSLSPRDAWQRNCAAAATAATFEEIQEARRLGVETVMWGSDYPHVEGGWPNSWQEIRQAFATVPEEDVRRMVGENAVRFYGFDPQILEPLVTRIGPPAGTFATAETPAPSNYTVHDFTNGWVNTYGGFARNMRRSLDS